MPAGAVISSALAECARCSAQMGAKMRRIAKFEKVSPEQFKEGFRDCFGEKAAQRADEIYEQIKLPKRATKGSAGYDFFSPVNRRCLICLF